MSVGLVFAGGGCNEELPIVLETDVTSEFVSEIVSTSPENTRNSEIATTTIINNEESVKENTKELEIVITYPEDSDLSYLKEYKYLEKLTLISNNFEPINGLDSIAEINSLNSLTLQNIQYNDWSFIVKIPNLKELNLYYCDIGHIYFDDDKGKMFDFTVLNELNNLDYLLVNNIYFNLNNINNLKNLKALNLGGDGEFGIYITNFDQIENLQNLESLSMYMSDPKDNDYSAIRECKNIKYLDFELITFSDISWISEMTQLEELRFQNTNLSDITPFTKLDNLKRLQLGEPYYTVDDMNKMKELLPNCIVSF